MPRNLDRRVGGSWCRWRTHTVHRQILNQINDRQPEGRGAELDHGWGGGLPSGAGGGRSPSAPTPRFFKTNPSLSGRGSALRVQRRDPTAGAWKRISSAGRPPGAGKGVSLRRPPKVPHPPSPREPLGAGPAAGGPRLGGEPESSPRVRVVGRPAPGAGLSTAPGTPDSVAVGPHTASPQSPHGTPNRPALSREGTATAGQRQGASSAAAPARAENRAARPPPPSDEPSVPANPQPHPIPLGDHAPHQGSPDHHHRWRRGSLPLPPPGHRETLKVESTVPQGPSPNG